MAVITLSTRHTLFLSKVAIQRHGGCWAHRYFRPAIQENAGRAVRRDACPHGHEYDEANTITRPNRLGNPSRECRECNRQRAQRNRALAKGETTTWL